MDAAHGDLVAQAKASTLARIREDAEKLPPKLRPILVVSEGRPAEAPLESCLFSPGLKAGSIWRKTRVRRSSKFSAILGNDLREYIILRRLDVAKTLLAQTGLGVTEIAHKIGWEYDAFYTMFLRKVGQSPTDYRESMTADGLMDAAKEARATGDFVSARAKIAAADEAVLNELRKRRQCSAESLYDDAVEQRDIGNGDLSYDLLQGVGAVSKLTGGISPEIITRSRATGLHWDTDEEFIRRLDKDDQKLFRSEKGETVRHYMRNGSLVQVPRDLEFFRECSDESYRKVWAAFDRARIPLRADAFHTWFISENAADPRDRSAPATLGLFIKCGVKNDELRSGNQKDRLAYCEFAVEIAQSLGDPRLWTLARIVRGNALRLLARYIDARTDFEATKEPSRLIRWLAAKHANMCGLYEYDKSNYTEALKLFKGAAVLYEFLDLHWKGIQLVEQGTVHFHKANYQESLKVGHAASRLLDGRRSPVVVNGHLPINLSASLNFMGHPELAEDEIRKCKYDRNAHPGLATTEIFGWACIHTQRKRYREAIVSFQDSARRCEDLGRHLDAALARIYSVEAYVELDRRAEAKEGLLSSLPFLEKAGCTPEIMESLIQLSTLVSQEAHNALAITGRTRTLAQQCGGRLPKID